MGRCITRAAQESSHFQRGPRIIESRPPSRSMSISKACRRIVTTDQDVCSRGLVERFIFWTPPSGSAERRQQRVRCEPQKEAYRDNHDNCGDGQVNGDAEAMTDDLLEEAMAHLCR